MKKLKKLSTILVLFLSIEAHAVYFAFQENFKRYPMRDDFIRLIQQKFPLAIAAIPQTNGAYFCESSFDIGRALGDNDPATGEPIFKEPSLPFVKWYVKCVRPLIQKDIEEAINKGKDPSYYLGSVKLATLNSKWLELSEQSKKAITSNLIDQFIGPGVLNPTQLKNMQALLTLNLAKKIKATNTVIEAIETMVFVIVLSDEFLMN